MPATVRILIVEDDPQDAALAERQIRRADILCTFLRVDARDAMVAALRDGTSPCPFLSSGNRAIPRARASRTLRGTCSAGVRISDLCGNVGRRGMPARDREHGGKPDC